MHNTMKSRMGLLTTALFLALCAVLMTAPSAHAGNDGLIGANIKDGQLLGYYGPGGDIVVPNTVTTIAPEAFKGNDNVTSITIPGSVSTIGYNAFEGCTVLKAVYFPDSKIGADLTIRVDAFMDCPQLEECIIPACASYVTGNIFKGCTSMTAIQVDPDNPYYMTDEYGVLFGPWVDEGVPQYSDPNLSLNAYPCGRPAGGYTIPETVNGRTVNRIWASSFRNAKNLTSVEIPATCTILGANGFEGTSLTELTIPATVQSVEPYLLAECKNLTDVVIKSPIIDLEMGMFENCTSLQRVEFPATLRSIGMYAFHNCTNFTSFIIPEGISSLTLGGFEGCTNLQRVYIPASVISFPNIDGSFFDPFEGASSNLIVYVVKGSNGEKWAYNHADSFGWKYQIIDGPHQLPTMDAGTFDLMDMGKKVKLTGAFHMGESIVVRNVTGGPEYDAFRSSTEGAVAVYEIAMANGAEAPASMKLGIGRPANMGTNAKLYALEGSKVVPLQSTTISGTLNAEISKLGYFAVIDDTVSGGETDPSVPTGIQLNRTTASLQVGSSVQLSATVTPNTAVNKSVTWKSSAPSVAEVSAKGVVRGVSGGTATITATTSNGLTATCKVTVAQDTKPTPPPTPTPSDAITAAAAVRAGNAMAPQGEAPFALNLSNASRISTVEVQFETTGSAVEVVGENGFVLLGDVNGRMSGGKFVGSAMLCFLNGERTLFSAREESTIAQFLVTGEQPTLKVTGLTISGWDSKDQVAYGKVTGIDPCEDTFVGSMSYDLNGDGVVDQLDITSAQLYYRAQKGDSNWNAAQHCDFNGDELIDIADFIDILKHFTVRH